MLNTPSIDNLRHWSKLYSATPHIAGDLDHAKAIRDLWQSYGLSAELVRYDVLQTFPLSASLQLLSLEGDITYEATLTEDDIPEDPTSSPSNGLPAFHGYSANGKVCAELVYANFGTLEDFELLASREVSVEGKIVICKYSKVFRGLKVRAAEKFGAIGVIIYTDPQEDGEFTTKNGYAHYPHGPARHPKAIQRGSVDFFSVAVGDPTTPGYPSLPGDGTERKDPGHAIPNIPSLPLSYAEATPFLKALNGYGLGPSDIGGPDGDWKGELEDVGYFTGPSKVKVSLMNEGTFKYSPIYNVISTITGESEESIVIGNHHDSWSCGAIDPVSGSTVMNEVVRGLGKLISKGWKPYRKIIIASWDMEEYGLVGSTEWAEEHAESLFEHCVAYLNLDGATSGGSILSAVGSPLLAPILRSVTQTIPSPISPATSSVYSDWLVNTQKTHPNLHRPHLDIMGTGSDYTAFYHHLGTPSLDLSFSADPKSVYQYHSNYDSYHWVDKFGDPGFKKHFAMAQLFGVLTVRISGLDIIPFKAVEYATALQAHTLSLKSTIQSTPLTLDPIFNAIQTFENQALSLDKHAAQESYSSSLLHTTPPTPESIKSINNRYISIERNFLLSSPSSSTRGLPDRPWFKHMVQYLLSPLLKTSFILTN
ncbi:putative glutamate carboxypeptidase [Phaeomoniella chlamydospora]|uniref:Putative glutamate carboxypeptidase n=1 Tax=Phaeomoniella chlamydospora TaxID=158046 RepID=A0A0G2E8I5_PHACM|nr:putative glutamate carboxypeptidase [Phaeomoniella chlamydospora]